MKKKVWGWSLRDEDQKRIRRSEKKVNYSKFFLNFHFTFLKKLFKSFFKK